jgi:excinuclease ABC subunit A
VNASGASDGPGVLKNRGPSLAPLAKMENLTFPHQPTGVYYSVYLSIWAKGRERFMDNDAIIVRGAREHNLRNVQLELPRNALIVFTGVSGSGKSSLAFDTLYAEGQRRYVESLSSYARQFLGQLPKPDVDYLGGLSPAISIQQKTAARNPRSTVGTITEVHDYLRVLYARVGQGHCPQCGRPITAQSREQIIGRIMALPAGSKFLVLAPVVRGQKGEFKDFFAEMLRRGFVRARVDGRIVRLADDQRLDKRIKHNIEIVIDRLVNEPKVRTRLAEAVEQALGLANGSVIVSVEGEPGTSATGDSKRPRTPVADAPSAPEDILLSAHYACLHCDRSYEPPSPQLFSFNSPMGMCPDCDGLGAKYTFDPDLLIPDPSKSFYDGAIPLVGPMRGMGRWRKHIYEGVGKSFGIDVKTPWQDLPVEQQNLLLQGAGDRNVTYEWKMRGGGVWKHGGKWEGIVPQLLASFKKTAAGPRRLQLEKYMRVVRCPTCKGQRLNAQARAVRVAGQTIVEAEAMTVGDLAGRYSPGGPLEAGLDAVQKYIAGELLKEIRARLRFLLDVGLHYLTLDRPAPTLSGGEAQRIRLAGQIGSGLVGVLYILDEPSIGLHPRDNERLLHSLQRLRDMGNTVLVVEHDEETMRSADFIVDFGPGPGVRGGEVVAAGDFRDIVANKNSVTGKYLSGQERIEIPKQRRSANGKVLQIVGARHHNLKNIDVDIPLGVFVCVTGVSGSGKSSLINDILLEGAKASGRRELANGEAENDESEEEFHDVAVARPGLDYDRIDGLQNIDKVIAIDQSPIGRTPRSNPATYIKVFDEIRSLYATVTDAKVRGYQPGRFSFNKPGGRCEACEGNGSNRLEMDFLADVWVTCPVCEGGRFNRETLQVRYRGKNIHDVLEMDVQEALVHFEHVPKIRAMLQTLHDVGMDYIKLGQPSPTLSGGEAQRIKLARELCRRGTGKTLYILDEPTTGLHFDDIKKLLQVLHGFADSGNTVVVIEHNLDVIKTADWIIDLGPEGGDEGGEVVATGTPEEVAANKKSHTGEALRKIVDFRFSITDFKKISAVNQKSKIKNQKSKLETLQSKITHLEVHGACEHNLKNISVRMPREAMSVCSGPSGSGKSSLALDTIYAEGQRRYVESLSSYARQFLGQVQKPKVEQVTGLSPAISIEQKTTSKSPRSTVGTVTEVYDYLRILYARLGQIYCPTCGIPVGTQTADEIIEKVLSLPEATKLYLMAPVERRGQERYESIWEEIRRSGFMRFRVDGKSYSVDEPPSIDHRRKHSVEVIVDRIAVNAKQRTRIADAVEAALDLGRGIMHVAHVDPNRDESQWKVERFSQLLACERCGRSFEQLNPHHFSFNSPLGWCPTCEGLGVQQGANVTLLIRDPQKSLREGAISAWPELVPENPFTRFAEAVAAHVGFSLDTPFGQLDPAHQRAVLHGTGDAWISLEHGTGNSERGTKKTTPRCEFRAPSFQYKGLFPAIDEAARVSVACRQRLDHLISEIPCSVCGGSRLRDDAAAVRFDNLTLGQMGDQPLAQTLQRFKDLKLTKAQQQVAGEVLREIKNRLQFLVDVGLDYLSLSRPGPTLSGGEAQRIRLASQIGSGLTGVLYVLDEPTIGLHPRDNERLLRALKHLRGLGNMLVLVEHDREVISAADHLLDFGPGAGNRGGEITASGTPAQVMKNGKSLTGQYLSGKKAIPVPTNRRLSAKPQTASLTVKGARHNNLKNIDVSFPLGALIAVTGVSGSGKSSLIQDILLNTLARRLHRARTVGAAHDDILGIENVDKVINVDQEPIGNTPSSNPATYTGVFDLIRQLFAQLPDAKVRGYQPSRFSFNKKGGRCEACEGNGQKKIEMHFLPDVWVECDICHGRRYNPETLAVRYHGQSIADVLDMSVGEALELFDNIPKIRQVLQTLADVGLDYIQLGQPAPTLSGGEAQRVKLAAELARPNTGRTLYLLDEPTTGLHFDDIRKLLDVLNRLVDLGNTVIVVEHNLDVIKTADWVIDLGPEAAERGGRVVAAGTPEEIVAAFNGKPKATAFESHTARFLAPILKAGPHAERPRFNPQAALAARDGDVELEAVGRDTRLPWEADGIGWHTQERVTNKGRRCRWEGDILTWLDEEIHRLGDFAETNWNHRTIVEIAAKNKTQGWFLHAMSGHEWLLRLVFRVGRNAFKQADLQRRLGLESFNEAEGTESCNREERVDVANRKGPWQEVAVLVHRLDELNAPAFRGFLKEAVAAFNGNLKKMQVRPEDVMPWKVAGERWHLSDKGFPIGRKIRWDRALLPRLIKVMREVEPNIEIKWDTRDAILFYVPGVSKSWARFRTKDDMGLDCRFVGKPGQYNLSRIETFGASQTLSEDRGDGSQMMQLVFLHSDHLHARELKELLREHLQGFLEMFAPATE